MNTKNFLFTSIIVLTFIYNASSYLKLNKTYINGLQIKAMSKSPNETENLFIWTTNNNKWEVLTYNHESNNLNFPFDTQNINFNMSELNTDKVISHFANNGKFVHLFKNKNSSFCFGDSNSINSGVGACHELKADSENKFAFPVQVSFVNYWPSFCYLEVGLNPPQTIIRNYGENYIYAILNEVSLDMRFLIFDGFYNFCLITKSTTNYNFVVIVMGQSRTLTKPLALMTGFEQYVGTKVSDHTLLWTEKTAYIHLNTGTELLSATLNDYILDMSSSENFIYVLTKKGIFQYLRRDFSLVSTIHSSFHEISKIDFVKSINQLVCISDTKIMFYILEEPSKSESESESESENENEDFAMKTVFVIVSILSVLRPYNLHSTFLLLANFDLYNYHQTNYDHFFGQVLKQVQIFENKTWNLIPSETLSNWMNAPYFSGIYEAFSNEKIVEFNGNDGLFIQNTKPFFLLWFPISFILFLSLNRLFLYFKKINFKKGMKILIGYSLWTNFLIIAVIQNSYILTFYSLSNFNLFFFFIPSIKIVQIVTILFFGLFFLLMIEIFPLVPYFHRRKVKIILDNPKLISPTIMFGFLKFFCKIIIECTIHYYLFDNPGKQKIMLCIINFSSVLLSIYFDCKYEVFRIKVVGWSGNIGEFIFVLFNICLFFQYNYIPTSEHEEFLQIFNNFSENCLILIATCSLITALFPYLQQILKKIFKKNKNKSNTKKIEIEECK